MDNGLLLGVLLLGGAWFAYAELGDERKAKLRHFGKHVALAAAFIALATALLLVLLYFFGDTANFKVLNAIAVIPSGLLYWVARKRWLGKKV